MQVLQSRVLLRPRDFDRSVTFYETGIGLVRYRDWGEAPHRGVVYFLGGGYLELAEGDTATQNDVAAGDIDPGDPPGEAPAQTPLVRLWLQVADISSTYADLVERSIPVTEAPALQPWGLIEMTVVDPDGLELVFIETPTSHPLRRRQ